MEKMVDRREEQPHPGEVPGLAAPALEGLLLDFDLAFYSLSPHLSKLGTAAVAHGPHLESAHAKFYWNRAMPLIQAFFYGGFHATTAELGCCDRLYSLHYCQAIYKKCLPAPGLIHCSQVSVTYTQFNPS